MKHTIIIIGAGQSASQAVNSLREFGFDGRIVLVGDEPRLPYHRPALSKKFLLGELPEERLAIRPEGYYRDLGVDLLLGTKVTAIERAACRIRLNDGSSLSYDKLLLATGARAQRLAVPGGNLPGVHYLRSYADAEALQQAMVPGRRLVVIGGGYIGCEIAAAGNQLGMQTILLEATGRLLTRVTGPMVAGYMAALHGSRGVAISYGVRIEQFEAVRGRVSAVRCATRPPVPADVVVVGVGATPCDDLARAAGLPCDNGILVDSRCQTADSRIFAAGDCTNHPNPLLGRRLRLECVHNAIEQAKAAAAAMMGRQGEYAAIPWFWSEQYDVKWQIAGLWQDHEQTVIRGNPDSGAFAMFYLRHGRLVAVDALNSPREFMACRRLLSGRSSVRTERLADASVPMMEVA